MAGFHRRQACRSLLSLLQSAMGLIVFSCIGLTPPRFAFSGPKFDGGGGDSPAARVSPGSRPFQPLPRSRRAGPPCSEHLLGIFGLGCVRQNRLVLRVACGSRPLTRSVSRPLCASERSFAPPLRRDSQGGITKSNTEPECRLAPHGPQPFLSRPASSCRLQRLQMAKAWNRLLAPFCRAPGDWWLWARNTSITN